MAHKKDKKAKDGEFMKWFGGEIGKIFDGDSTPVPQGERVRVKKLERDLQKALDSPYPISLTGESRRKKIRGLKTKLKRGRQTAGLIAPDKKSPMQEKMEEKNKLKRKQAKKAALARRLKAGSGSGESTPKVKT